MLLLVGLSFDLASSPLLLLNRVLPALVVQPALLVSEVPMEILVALESLASWDPE